MIPTINLVIRSLVRRYSLAIAFGEPAEIGPSSPPGPQRFRSITIHRGMSPLTFRAFDAFTW